MKLQDLPHFLPWEADDERELPELVYAVHDCPLCGAPAPARGLADLGPAPQIVYECQACGEITLHPCAP
ncbi:MAG TPA: hypothetical protein VKZ60_01285 [Chloroflexota bacterium]|nr:hypothetical protein [Chloroflexota bacterium]